MPPIHPEEFWYVQAFYDLSTCRPSGMAVGAIPWRDILLYAQFHEIDDYQFAVFKTVITAMDATFIRFHDKAAADRRKNPPPVVQSTALGEKTVERPGEVGPRRSKRYQRGT